MSDDGGAQAEGAAEGAEEVAAEVPEKMILLFDVDGTITPSRKPISQEFLAWMTDVVRSKAETAIVGGADMNVTNQQLRGNAPSKFKYVFAENGLITYKDGESYSKHNIVQELGDDFLQEFMNFCLDYMSKLQLPIKRGQFTELRHGLINICPLGRNCTSEEREKFTDYDKKNKVRARFIEAIKQRYPDRRFMYNPGGQISFDIYPEGWHKGYCLNQLERDGYNKIHFFGDRTAEGGTDFEIGKDPRVICHKVTGPDDTKRQIAEVLGL